MTVAEFLDWSERNRGRWELVDGAPRAMAPAAPRHGAILGEVGRLIGNHLADAGPGCRVIIEPDIKPKVRGDFNARVPDLAIMCGVLAPDDRLLLEPLVVIEILSPSNRQATWENVWSYVTIPSVLEVLVLHTGDIRADLLHRERDGGWPDNPVALGLGDAVALDSIGFTAPLASFYRTA